MDPETSDNDGSYRFSPVTFNDHAGQLWIVTILSLIYSTLVALARIYIKYGKFGFDDIFFALAMVFHLAQSITVFIGLSNGLGKFNSITTPEQWATASKSTLAAGILCLLTLSLAKCSVLALIRRIVGSKPGKSEPVCIGLMVITVVWGAGSCLAWLVNCHADSLLALDNVKQCPHQNTRWAVITAMDILTEILTWLLVLQLSWSVNISYIRKCQVVMAFSFRIPLIALSAVHLAYSATNPASTEPQFAVTKSLLCQQIMIAWSLISATVPNLKNFLKSFSIGMGFPVSFDLSMSGSSNVYALQSLRNNRAGVTSSAAVATAVKSTSDSAARSQPHSWRPDQVSSQTTAARDSGSNSRDDISEEGRNSRAGSQEVIINKAVTWKVTYEDNQYIRR
ncbi:hypothetical protein FOVG_17426 [Fusarium oxysporum f. sp. pisi HDV247]|uniref:Rhodopsin domain-containing protein n=3 Tax=Fusarium oxysporum TaxID=5507 RepID=A0A420NQ95_FUSOX|nr:hypothetical protein FOVG_17426 [Fusarium oxysporum f. sp. pisi HDV247]RKK82417.1 hypothetical protein BFJ68_g17541 [Fusarium oxysporum]